MFHLNKYIKEIVTKMEDALISYAETSKSVALLMSKVESWIIEQLSERGKQGLK